MAPEPRPREPGWGSGGASVGLEVEFAFFGAVNEGGPDGSSYDVGGCVGGLGVADADAAFGQEGYLNAVGAVAAAVGGFAPSCIVQFVWGHFHWCAAFLIRSLDAVAGRASALIASNRASVDATSVGSDVVWPRVVASR